MRGADVCKITTARPLALLFSENILAEGKQRSRHGNKIKPVARQGLNSLTPVRQHT